MGRLEDFTVEFKNYSLMIYKMIEKMKILYQSTKLLIRQMTGSN